MPEIAAIFRRILTAILPSAPITKVTVRNSEFQLVRVLTSPVDLVAFDEWWSRRAKVENDARVNPLYSIVIERNGRSERWQYDPVGLTKVLSIKNTPIYRLSSPADFNTLLQPSDPRP